MRPRASITPSSTPSKFGQEDDEAGSPRPFASAPLRKRLAAQTQDARARILPGGRRIEARWDDVGAHHHAGAATGRRVVDRAMAADPVLTDVARVQQP
jgi:hypothetical protein